MKVVVKQCLKLLNVCILAGGGVIACREQEASR